MYRWCIKGIVKAMDIIFVFEVTTVHIHHAVYWVVFAV